MQSHSSLAKATHLLTCVKAHNINCVSLGKCYNNWYIAQHGLNYNGWRLRCWWRPKTLYEHSIALVVHGITLRLSFCLIQLCSAWRLRCGDQTAASGPWSPVEIETSSEGERMPRTKWEIVARLKRRYKWWWRWVIFEVDDEWDTNVWISVEAVYKWGRNITWRSWTVSGCHMTNIILAVESIV